MCGSVLVLDLELNNAQIRHLESRSAGTRQRSAGRKSTDRAGQIVKDRVLSSR